MKGIIVATVLFGIIVATVLFGMIVYGLLRPDQFSEVYSQFKLNAEYFLSLLSKNTLHLEANS